MTRKMASGPVYQGLLKRLAALAVAMGSATASAATELSAIPLHLVKDLVDADEFNAVSPQDRVRLLSLLANDPRAALRVCIAERVALHAGAVIDDDTEDLLERLALDPDPLVRQAVSVTIQRLLPQLSGIERTSLIGRWATSAAKEQRLIVARALQQRFVVLWDDLIIEHLLTDEDQAIRGAAFQAAQARGFLDRESGFPLA